MGTELLTMKCHIVAGVVKIEVYFRGELTISFVKEIVDSMAFTLLEKLGIEECNIKLIKKEA